MKVYLVDYTGRGNSDPANSAAAILIFTKSTRLEMKAGLLHEIEGWPYERKLEELKYMANTIPSSWEFVDYTFMIEGVTRAFTHQFVRSRQFSFAQQTMRVLNVGGWDYLPGPTVSGGGKDPNNTGADLRKAIYSECMVDIAKAYDLLIEHGAAIEDARGVLPTNILTNIVGKCNMRTFVELVRKRSSSRTQGEYRDVLEAMKSAVREVHPWIDLFIERDFDKAANELDTMIRNTTEKESGPYNGCILKDQATKMIKLIDQMRAQS